MAMNGPIPSSIIQMAQQFYQQVAGATGNGPITLNLHNKRKQGFTYNMSAQDVEQLVTDRLSKLNLSLETLKTEPDWNGNFITYQGLRMETLPNMRKQYCYARDGINILLNIRDASRIRIHLIYSTRNASR